MTTVAAREGVLEPDEERRWKPSPYAMSSTTVTIPHAVPSMVSDARTGGSPARCQACATTSLSSIGVARYSSYRSASTGGSAAARVAGYVEASTPTTASVAIASRDAGHVTTIPERSGIGSRLTRRHRPTPSEKPMTPLTTVSRSPSRKNWRAMTRGSPEGLADSDLVGALLDAHEP